MLAKNIVFGAIRRVPSYFCVLVAELIDNYCDALPSLAGVTLGSALVANSIVTNMT